MALESINRDHIIQAIELIDKNGIQKGRHSSTYDLVYEGKLYPPKLVISLAHKFVDGNELSPKDFEGGLNTPAFIILENEGFEIVPKEVSITKILNKFISQSQNGDLKTKSYPKKYQDYKIKVSFGQGVAAKIPWVAIYKPPNKVSNGIYPVYLYYKKFNKLILAYGISETEKPLMEWPDMPSKAKDKKKINDWAIDSFSLKADRYGSSYIKAIYDLTKPLDPESIERDLIEILRVYSKLFKKYWLYAPGKDASKWDEFFKKNIMAIGWDEIGDLSQYKSKENIAAELRRVNNETGSKKNDALACYEFASVIKPGDIVIAKKGKRDYVGWGVVSGEHIYDDTQREFKNRRAINWKSNGEWTDETGDIVLKTLTDITKYPDYVKRLSELLKIELNKIDAKNIKMNHPLNTILYGPPGTGKTYNSIMRAAEIIEGRKISSYSEALNIFNANLHDKIEFITFHQNYSYEDFIQGLRPNATSEDQLTFKKVDGVFKRIADRASGKNNFINKNIHDENYTLGYYGYIYPDKISNKLKESNKHLGLIAGKIEKNDFEISGIELALEEDIPEGLQEIFENELKIRQELQTSLNDDFDNQIKKYAIDEFSYALNHFIENQESSESEWDFPLTKKVSITGVNENGFQYYGESWSSKSSDFVMNFSDLIEFYKNEVRIRKDIKNLNNISELAKQHATYFFNAYYQILHYLPERMSYTFGIDYDENTIGHTKESRELIHNILSKYKYNGQQHSLFDDEYYDQKIGNQNKNNYVIIIDEINRANISRVFGELITLIEPDKRSNGSTPLEVRLPSGDEFVVPSNLYIIGTMNTADKSIALLDIALRRRFEFEPMYPKYEIEGQEIYNIEILKKINEQIINSKGHDFQIGHSYFMGENKDLVNRMNKKVIPLLLEYYMNDEKEVKKILNSAGLIIEENSWPIKISGKND